jgi:hypothetical protein
LRGDGTWATPVGTTYNIATATTAGLVELFSDTDQTVAANDVSATADRTYGIQLNAANQMVVNVPWSDTNTTYSVATATTAGLIEIFDSGTVYNPLPNDPYTSLLLPRVCIPLYVTLSLFHFENAFLSKSSLIYCLNVFIYFLSCNDYIQLICQ